MIRKALVAMFCIVRSVLLSQDVTVMAQDARTTRARTYRRLTSRKDWARLR